MDRLDQAERILALLSPDRSPGVVAGRALSPMDCQRTVPVARRTIRDCEAAAVVDPEMIRAAEGVTGASRTAHRPA